jgi:phosphoserine phosphatase RsbU/P
LTLDRVIASASAGLVKAAEGALVGRPFAELVCAPQRRAFTDLLRGSDGAWVTVTLTMDPGSSGAVADRVVHVRLSDAGMLVIAEPADRDYEQHLGQLLDINETLIRTQRELAEGHQELVLARDEAERVVRRLRTFERITVAAMEDDDPDAGMRTLLDQARELVGGQRSSLLLIDADRRQLTMMLRLGTDADEPVGWRQPIDAGITGVCVSTGRAIIVDDAQHDSRVGVVKSAADGSLVVVPLRVRGEVVGVLHVGSDQASWFTDEHVALLAAIGDRAAAVIARMQNTRRERRIAETFQRSMLPSALPLGALELVSHYQPQAEGSAVGGDWYDAITFPDGQVGLCIGDVAGKGVEAAVCMGQVRSAMHALALTEREPGRLLAQLDLFVATLATMVTVFYALVDPVAHTVTYATAGHLPALRRSPDGHVDVLSGARSPPLGFGLFTDRQAVTSMMPGMQLVLYTDGLIERRNEDLLTSLQSLAARCTAPGVLPSALAQHLLDTAEKLPAEYDDDVAILTAHFLPKGRHPLPDQPTSAVANGFDPAMPVAPTDQRASSERTRGTPLTPPPVVAQTIGLRTLQSVRRRHAWPASQMPKALRRTAISGTAWARCSSRGG